MEAKLLLWNSSILSTRIFQWCQTDVRNWSYLHPNMADTENGKLEYPCFLFVFNLFSNIVISNV